ncbi:FmdB family zinc ribbon protein [Halobaculum sp. P14]|uniref:FmdB family zinc ribbon protein n=1 Tax=Halobaculum sp. P14 TaxID=3421638 RepID=UPI003EBFA0F5
MGIVEAVARAVVGGESGVAEDTFRYRCVDCDTEFERPKTRMVRVRCPECGSMNLRDAAG